MKTVSEPQTQFATDWRPEPFPEPRTIPAGWDVSVWLSVSRDAKEATVTCYTVRRGFSQPEVNLERPVNALHQSIG